MAEIIFNVKDVGGVAGEHDQVTFWSPEVRSAAHSADGVVSTSPRTVRLRNGKATLENVEPGPLRIRLETGGVDPQVFDVVVPETGTVTLRTLLLGAQEFNASEVDRVVQAAATVEDSARRAETAAQRAEENAKKVPERGPVGERGPQGPRGERGERGPVGPAATIKQGSITLSHLSAEVQGQITQVKLVRSITPEQAVPGTVYVRW